MLGMGRRPELAWMIQKRKDIGFIEISAEDFCAKSKPIEPIKQLIDRGIEVIVHGTTLNLGGSEIISRESLAHLDSSLRHRCLLEETAFRQARIRACGRRNI
jgi:uncharacterized protein